MESATSNFEVYYYVLVSWCATGPAMESSVCPRCPQMEKETQRTYKSHTTGCTKFLLRNQMNQKTQGKDIRAEEVEGSSFLVASHYQNFFPGPFFLGGGEVPTYSLRTQNTQAVPDCACLLMESQC